MTDRERDHIRLERDEFFGEDIDRALAKRRASLGSKPPDPPPLSPIRRVLYSTLFYLPAAGLLGAYLSWYIIEPAISDMSIIGGEVALVNTDPFIADDMTSLTVEGKELLIGEMTDLEPGADGQPAYASIADIAVGDVIEAAGPSMEGLGDTQMFVVSIRPATPTHALALGVHMAGESGWAILLFPLTATLVALFLLLAEGVSSRNYSRMIPRVFIGSFLAMLFSFIAYVPAIAVFLLGSLAIQPSGDELFVTASTMSPWSFIFFAACRSMAWAFIGVGLGIGLNLVRSTRAQLRNSAIGGALGGALGGVFFDPIDRFVQASPFSDSSMSRLVGLMAVGLCIGLFLALVERFARTAWLRVRTGPLAGKAFVLYRTPTTIGSSPEANIYLFKDAEIDPTHAQIHRIGNSFEVEDLGSRTGTAIGTQTVRRRRLVSGDQITIGSTVLEFEERAKQQPNP